MIDTSDLLRISTAARKKGVEPEAIYRLLRNKAIPCVEIDSVKFVAWRDVKDYQPRNYPRSERVAPVLSLRYYVFQNRIERIRSDAAKDLEQLFPPVAHLLKNCTTGAPRKRLLVTIHPGVVHALDELCTCEFRIDEDASITDEIIHDRLTRWARDVEDSGGIIAGHALP